MEDLLLVKDYLVTTMRRPALFIGFITLLGLVLQKKKIDYIIKGTIKSIVGILVLFAGVDVVIQAINPLAEAFAKLFAVKDSRTVADFGVFLEAHGSEIGIVMLLGFVGNIVVARFTPFKSIFLAGNIIFWFAMLFVAVGVEAGLSGTGLILFALFFQILYIVISPWLVRPFVWELTEGENFTIGHTASMYCIMGALIGKVVGDKTRNTEDIELPKFIDFFRDTVVVSGLVLFIVNLIVAVGLPVEDRLAIIGKDFFIQCLMNGMKFSAGMVIILTGVRMMLSEIVPAFDGISQRLIKGAVPALDIPLVFPYGPNSLIIGFIIAMFTSTLTIFIMGFTGMLVVTAVPLTIACYFDVAPGAIFANKQGGVLAAIVFSAIGGVVLILLVSFTIPLVASTVGSFLQAYGGNDFSLMTLLSTLVSRIF